MNNEINNMINIIKNKKYYGGIDNTLLSQMDMHIARENLSLFNRISKKHDSKPFLYFGTLLGLYRNGDLIGYDYDIDVGILRENIDEFFDSFEELYKNGFKIVRIADFGCLISFMRYGCYIDVYIANKVFSFCLKKSYYIGGAIIERPLVDNLVPFFFRGEAYWAPQEIENNLIELYGEDWKVPKKNCPSKNSLALFDIKRTIIALVKVMVGHKIYEKCKRQLFRLYHSFDDFRA